MFRKFKTINITRRLKLRNKVFPKNSIVSDNSSNGENSENKIIFLHSALPLKHCVYVQTRCDLYPVINQFSKSFYLQLRYTGELLFTVVGIMTAPFLDWLHHRREELHQSVLESFTMIHDDELKLSLFWIWVYKFCFRFINCLKMNFIMYWNFVSVV